MAVNKTPYLLILDDFHTIELQAIQNSIQYWIEHVPPHVHTIITSRSEPPFPLSRWRVRGQLQEISSRALQFTQEETAAFFTQQMQLNLTTNEISKLMQIVFSRQNGRFCGNLLEGHNVLEI